MAAKITELGHTLTGVDVYAARSRAALRLASLPSRAYRGARAESHSPEATAERSCLQVRMVITSL